jgi:hypothetical protein
VAAEEQGGMVEEDTTTDSLHLPTQSSNEFCLFVTGPRFNPHMLSFMDMVVPIAECY